MDEDDRVYLVQGLALNAIGVVYFITALYWYHKGVSSGVEKAEAAANAER
jgi:hypothetical protein